MILKAIDKDKIPVYDDLRNVEGKNKQTKGESLKSDYIHLVPPMPKWTDKEYTSQNETQNVYRLTCTCDDYKERAELFEERDVRIICRHLFWKLTKTRAYRFLDKLTELLAHDSAFYREWIHYKSDFEGRDMIIGKTNLYTSGWLNIYYQFYGKTWMNLSYNYQLKRWRRGLRLPKGEEIENHLKMLRFYYWH